MLAVDAEIIVVGEYHIRPGIDGGNGVNLARRGGGAIPAALRRDGGLHDVFVERDTVRFLQIDLATAGTTALEGVIAVKRATKHLARSGPWPAFEKVQAMGGIAEHHALLDDHLRMIIVLIEAIEDQPVAVNATIILTGFHAEKGGIKLVWACCCVESSGRDV